MAQLKLSKTDRVLGGVLGGIAEFSSLPSSLLRIVFVICVFLGIGTPILLYILTWILMAIFCKND